MKTQPIRWILFCFVGLFLLTGCLVSPESKLEKAVILKPVLLAPEDKAVITNAAPKFEWYAISGVEEYTFEIKLVSDDTVVFKGRYDASNRCDLTQCAIPSPVELAPGEYKWHVVGWVDEQRGEYSKYFTLTVSEE